MEVCLNLKLINQKHFLGSSSVISDDFHKLFLLSAEMPKDIYKKYYIPFSQHIETSA